ncbi:hypothetical protein GGR50DRAFT_691143 [Xylaria sp. CBS 124048]|nr:hypothetical protein GGR50DRAFT_691143 [Xylaria sp. CBS 124048]
MHASTSAIATALMGLASAQTVHVVTVSSANGLANAYTPNNLVASVGDLVQFQFLDSNHSVTQSNFDNPCVPIAQEVTNETGIFSGFMPVQAGAATIPTYTVQVTSTTPLWLYCAQVGHCQAGMVMVINENTAANATRSLDNFRSMAAQVPTSVVPPVTTGTESDAGLTDAVTGTIANPGAGASNGTSPTSSNATVSPGSFNASSNPGTGSSSGSGSGSTTPPKVNFATAVSVSAWTGVFGIAAALALL